MAARFGMLCHRGVVNRALLTPLQGLKIFRASSSLTTASALLSSPSSSSSSSRLLRGVRSQGVPSLSSPLFHSRLASEQKGSDYVHGSLTKTAAEVVSRTPREISFQSIMDELLEDEDDDAARTDDEGKEGKDEKKEAKEGKEGKEEKPEEKEPPPAGADWRDHYTGGYANVKELEEDLKRYPDQLDRETYVPPSEDKAFNWEEVYRERGLWTQDVADAHAVRNPLLHRGEDDLVILPCERRMDKGKKFCNSLRNNGQVPGCIFFKNDKRALIQMHPRFLISAFETLDYYALTYWLDFGEGKRLRVKPCNPVPFSSRNKKPHSVNFLAMDQPPPPGEPEFYEKYEHTKQQIQIQWRNSGLVTERKPDKRRHPKLLTKSQRCPAVKKRVEIHPLTFEGGKDNTLEWSMTSNMFLKQEEVLKKYPAFEGKRCGDF